MTAAATPPAGAGLRPVTPLSILTARLQHRRERLTDLDPQLRAELVEACELAEGLDPYLETCTTPESPALAALAERTRAAAWSGSLEAEMLSGHVEGQVLRLLVHATRARRVLEIGMFTGYSALAMAEALPPGGVVVACELDPQVAAFARDCFSASPRGAAIDVRVGPAGDTLQALAQAGQPFDLVFVDADKAGYLDYVDAVLTGGLLAPHGLICVDNTLLQGQAYAEEPADGPGRAVAEFNAAIAADPRVAQALLPLRDGLTLLCRVDEAGVLV